MLTCIKGIGEKTKTKFNSLGIFTPNDLIMTFPKKYIDMTKTVDLSQAVNGDFCVADINIVKVNSPFKKGRLQVLKVFGLADKKEISMVFFNQNYIAKIIKEQEIYTIYSKLIIDKDCNYSFINPSFEKKGIANSKFKGIQPIYRTKGIIPQKTYKELVKNAIKENFVHYAIIDPQTEIKYNLMPYKEAIYAIHNPESLLQIEQANKRIETEFLVKRIAAFRAEKQESVKKYKYQNDIEKDLNKFIDQLEFQLTDSQKRAVEQIINKLYSNDKMNVMLCGDVGSGKTIVALMACFFVIKNGYQAAIMAPTEILAKQHFERAKKVLDCFNIKIVLLTSNTDKTQRDNIIKGLKDGSIDLAIGTHSLLNANIDFSKIALAVLDEQHRFGVGQRTALIEKDLGCEILTLTATPIPRSLQLIAYGEIDYISIEKRYENNISTFIVNREKRNSMLSYVAEECKKGKKAIIISPRIEDNEGIDISSVKELYKELSLTFFKEQKTSFIHGKLKEEQKNQIIEKFRNDKLSMIVSTSVVEVGIDIPDLSIIVIMNSERFGLSSLHQLRGRAGRDGNRAYCFLYTEKTDVSRLQKLVESNNGLEIAEYDYMLRGGGNIFGTEQTGESQFSFINNKNLQLAKEIVNGMDLKKFKDFLMGEIKRNNLNEVSLT